MKKIIPLLLLSLSLPLLASCVGSSSSSDNGKGYTVSLLAPDGTPLKDESVSVMLLNSKEHVSKTIDKVGKARFNDVESGSYRIHIENLPDAYGYNPNAYNIDEENRSVTITLETCNGVISSRDLTDKEVDNPYRITKGSGLWLYESRYIVNEGLYKVTFEKGEHALYVGTAPNKTGQYTFTSYAEEEYTLNAIDPTIGLCGTGIAYQFEEPIEVYDDMEGSKNFSATFEATLDDFIKTDEADENGELIPELDEDGNMICGSSWTYQIKTNSATEYPASFYFSFKRTGDVSPKDPEPEKEVPHASETRTSPEGEEGKEFKWCTFEGEDEPVYNENDKYYHLNDKNGPLLYASLKGDNQWFDYSIYMCAAIQGTSYFITDNGTKDYNEFFNEYCQLCNNDGYAAVTEELKQFLIALEYARVFFNREGLAGYISNDYKDGYQWLCLVGYYDTRAGLNADNPIYLENNDSTVYTTIEGGETLYFEGNSNIESTWTIENENSNFKFVYNDKEEFGADNYSFVISNKDGKASFSVTNTSESKLYLIMQVTYTVVGANTDLDHLVVGMNQIRIDSSNFDSESTCAHGTFTSPKDGSYHLESSCASSNFFYEVDGVTYSYSTTTEEKSSSFQLKSGESLTINLAFDDIYAVSGMIYFAIVAE